MSPVSQRYTCSGVDVLLRQPLGISLHVNHRDGAAVLKYGYQLEKKRCRRPSAHYNLLLTRCTIILKIAMGRDATEVQPLLGVPRYQSTAQQLTQCRTSLVLKRQNATENQNQWLWREWAAGVRDRQACSMKAVNTGDLLLSMLDLICIN